MARASTATEPASTAIVVAAPAAPSPSAGSAEAQRALDTLNERTHGPLPAGGVRDLTTWTCGYCGDRGHHAEDCGDRQEASRA
jgi:hypothetical protein